jgi:ATP-dependent Lon protease
MKESGQAALTFARWRLADLGTDEGLLSRHQVHVHVPAGAIPKDGPSAGITIAVALASLATGIPVRPDVAMTGEVTLRGRVLPVGGVREKVLAALRSGIKTVILPERSMPELNEIPGEIARKIEFIGVSHMDQVLEAALERMPARRKSKVRGATATSARAGIAAAKGGD